MLKHSLGVLLRRYSSRCAGTFTMTNILIHCHVIIVILVIVCQTPILASTRGACTGPRTNSLILRIPMILIIRLIGPAMAYWRSDRLSPRPTTPGRVPSASYRSNGTPTSPKTSLSACRTKTRFTTSSARMGGGLSKTGAISNAEK